MPELWWVELSLFPLKGRAASGGVFGVSVRLVRLQAVCLLMGGAVFLSCWLFGMRSPALEPAGSCVEPVLVLIWIPLKVCMPINIPCAQEFSGCPVSWTQPSPPGAQEPDPQPGNQEHTSCAVWPEKKEKKRRQTDKPNPRQIAKTTANKQQPRQHTDTERKKRKKKQKQENKQKN